jgi:hypothetical protein
LDHWIALFVGFFMVEAFVGFFMVEALLGFVMHSLKHADGYD